MQHMVAYDSLLNTGVAQDLKFAIYSFPW